MLIAVLSDIHGNRTAFEAVLVDLARMAPDRVFHAGDLADTGSSPVAIVDQIRMDLKWPGVVGNTDEMLFRPMALTSFAANQPPPLRSMFDKIGEMAEESRSVLGQARLDWLRSLPTAVAAAPGIQIVHASTRDLWRAPGPDASEADFDSAFESGSSEEPRSSCYVYGHIHRPFVRQIGSRTMINTGSVGLPYDGDPRASYLLLHDNGTPPLIRRVEYDIHKEIRSRIQSGMPHGEWVARMLLTASPQLP